MKAAPATLPIDSSGLPRPYDRHGDVEIVPHWVDGVAENQVLQSAVGSGRLYTPLLSVRPVDPALTFLHPFLSDHAGRGSGEAQSPFLRIPGRVKPGVNRHCRFRVLEEDGIRKSPYQGPAVLLMNAGIDRGLPANALHGRIDRTQILLAKPYSATLIPNISFSYVEFGFWRNNQFSGHTGRAPFVSHLPRTVPRPGFLKDSLFCAPVRVSASRGPAPLLASPQGRPTDLRRVEVSPLGLDQRSTIQRRSFGSLQCQFSQNLGPLACVTHE